MNKKRNDESIKVSYAQQKVNIISNSIAKDNRIKDIKEERRMLALQLEKENKDQTNEKLNNIQILNQRKLIQD